MKAILALTVLLGSVSSFAASTDVAEVVVGSNASLSDDQLVEGQGMYCAADARSYVKNVAATEGVSADIIAKAETASVDPTDGSAYIVTIGSVNYAVITSADDGTCKIISVTGK